MAYTPVVLFIVGIGLFPRLFPSTRVGNLRKARYIGVSGRFPVDRDALEDIILTYKKDNFGNSDVDLSLPESLPHADYDHTRFAEIFLTSLIVQERFPGGVRGKKVAPLVRRPLYISIPIVMKGKHGVLRFAELTDRASPITLAGSLNRNGTIIVDSIEDAWNCSGQTVTYRLDDEPLIQLATQYNAMCVEDRIDEKVSDDFDHVIGSAGIIRILDLYRVFDWGCDGFAADYKFCKKLEEYGPEIEEADGNVCLEKVLFTRRCEAAMTVDRVSDVLLDKFPFLSDIISAPSVETEFFDDEPRMGITFPCIE